MPDTDASLSLGPQSRFGRLVLPELDAMFRLAFSLTGQTADAEDLVQDTVLRAFRSIEKFDGAHPRAWLFTIMRQTFLNNRRRRRLHLVLGQPEWRTKDNESVAPVRGEPEHTVGDASLDDRIAAAFCSLPRKYRAVIRLVDITGLDYREASAVLHIQPGTVASRVHRARAQMRHELANAGLGRESDDRTPDTPPAQRSSIPVGMPNHDSPTDYAPPRQGSGNEPQWTTGSGE